LPFWCGIRDFAAAVDELLDDELDVEFEADPTVTLLMVALASYSDAFTVIADEAGVTLV